MVNKLQKSVIKDGASKVFKSVLLTGGMLFFVLKPNISKSSPELKQELMQILKTVPVKEWKMVEPNKTTEKLAKIEVVGNANSSLDYAIKNVSQYYPDMKDHLDTLLNNFRNDDQKNAVDSLLNEHIMKNITDPKQRIAAILYSIEKYAYLGNDKITRRFSQLHVKDIDRNNAQFIFNGFGKGYVERFNAYCLKLEKILSDLQKDIEQNKKDIEQNKKDIEQNKKDIEQNKREIEQGKKIIENQKKEIEGILGQFTVNDIKSKPEIKKLVLDTEALYIKHKYTISTHLSKLIQAAKE